MGPTVSVVVPVFGVEAFLERCLASVLSQTHRDLEIILVDDGSTDRSGEICDAYAAKDARVRVFHQANAGVASARNVGVAAATADLIVFVDSDDWVAPELVEHLLDVRQHTGAELVVCDFVRVRDGEDPTASSSPGEVEVRTGRETLDQFAGHQAGRLTAPWCKLFDRKLLAGNEFPVGRRYEDDFVLYRVIDRARTVALTPRQLYFYVIHPASATQGVQSATALLDRVDALLGQADFFAERGLDAAQAASARKAFLILRKVRREILADGDPQLLSRLSAQLRAAEHAVAAASANPPALRVFAKAYAVAPGPLDIALAGMTRIRNASGQSELPDTTAAETPPVEVVVVAYGSPELLRACLTEVAELPVTVIDNSSMPEIEALCDELRVRYFDPGHNGGFAAGVNEGLRHRKFPTSDILLLNPDAVISVAAIQALQRALRAEPDLASVGPIQGDGSGTSNRVTWPFPSPWGTWLDTVGLWRLRRGAGYVSGSILLLRAEAIAAVGPFDERFFLYAEEADWQLRARRLGWRHSVVDSVRAVHLGAATSNNEDKRLAHFHGSQEKFLRKHYGSAGWQLARLGQVLGDSTRGLVWRGEPGRRARARAQLYRRGPAGAESAYLPKFAGQGHD